MAFWGVEVKPGKPYTHFHDSDRGALRVSQATLGDGTTTKRSVVQCNVGNKSPVLLCSLLPDRTESCCLDLHFEEDDEVVFSVVGPSSVHLTGYFLGESRNGGGDADDSDSYGEDIWEMGSEDSGSSSGEDEDESDFIDDGDIAMSPSPRRNSGVVIEEIIEDEKPANGIINDRHLEKKHQANDSDEGEAGSQRQIVVKHNKSPILESEDEDGFPISFSSSNKENGKNIGDDKISNADRKRKLDAIKGIERKVKVDTVSNEKLKKKKKDKAKSAKSHETDVGVPGEEKGNMSAEEQNRDADDKRDEVQADKVKSGNEGASDEKDSLSSPILSASSGHTTDKSKKKKKRTKDANPLDNENKSSGILGKDGRMESNDNELSNSQEKIDDDQPIGELPHNTNANSNGGSAVDVAHEANKKQKKNKRLRDDSATDKELDSRNKAVRKPRTFANGLVIEELSMGQPDGKRASPGKTVFVCYIGKLRNGKIFDSNVGQKPFKFRLGVGQVIKGWDVGVDGMRIGDKRRLTIPPSMGYGEKGAGGVIPGNAWLIFDVELVDVK